jgi:hypothetical protein
MPRNESDDCLEGELAGTAQIGFLMNGKMPRIRESLPKPGRV